MKLFTNGFPKSGNHALVKACELLGQPASVNHIPFADGLPEGTTRHIFIKRDPRNIIVSWIRFQNKQTTPGMFLTYFRKFGTASIIDETAKFEKWFSNQMTFVVRYENLIVSDVIMRKMAEFMDVPYIDGAFEALPGLTVTWNPHHADYTTIWTPEVQSAWATEGGNELLARWGY